MSTPLPTARRGAGPARSPRPVRTRLSSAAPELGLLTLLAGWSLLPLAILFVGVDGGLSLDLDQGLFTGADGLGRDDQLQYLAWVREAGEHLLNSSRFDTASEPRLFLHPMLALSGLAYKLGASVQLAYLAWKPVAVALLGIGYAAYVHRMLGPDRGARAAALALALFFLTPAAVLVDWLDLGSPALQFSTLVIGLEMFAAAYPWGGYTGTIAIALVPFFLLGIERLLDPERRASARSARWYALWSGLAGMLSSWLHPWQGLTLLVIVTGLVVWGGFGRRYLSLAVPVAMTAVPLVYLFILSRTDTMWGSVSQPSGSPHLGLWLFLALAPAALALPGLRGRADDIGERLLRLWPAAVLIVYFGLQQSWFYHAFNGVTVPLAVLAVRAARNWPIPRPARVAAVLVLTLPGMVYAVAEFRQVAANHFLPAEEGRALEYIDDSPREGPVLAVQELGVAVPAFTGRQTWVGHYYHTPDYEQRTARARDLFAGRLGPAEARALVRESRAGFLIAACPGAVDLEPALGPIVLRVTRFGCAAVYELRTPA